MTVDGSAFRTDGYPIVAPAERGAVDRNATVDFGNANVKLQYDPTDRIQATFRAGYFREERDNGKVSTIDGTAESNDTTWKTISGADPHAAAGREHSAGERVRRRRDVSQQLPRGARRDTAAEHRPDDAEPARADRRRRRASSSGRAASAAASSSPPAPTGAGSTATARRTGSTRRPARRSRCGASPAARSGVPASTCRICYAGGRPDGHAERAGGQLEELRRPQHRVQRAQRHADGEQRSRTFPSATTPSSARASPPGITSPTGSACGGTSAPGSARRR